MNSGIIYADVLRDIKSEESNLEFLFDIVHITHHTHTPPPPPPRTHTHILRTQVRKCQANNQPIIFVLEEMDALASHRRQSLLYTAAGLHLLLLLSPLQHTLTQHNTTQHTHTHTHTHTHRYNLFDCCQSCEARLAVIGISSR